MIPKLLFQIGNSMSNFSYLWSSLNPDYTFKLLSDDICNTIISTMDTNISVAYSKVKVGVMRADMCRLAALLKYGGIYTDTDVIPYFSLYGVIPENATFLSTEYYSFEFIGSIPNHPFIDYALRESAQRVLDEVHACNTMHVCCRGSHQCIIKKTGPAAYFQSIIKISKRLGCTNKNWVPATKHCANSEDYRVRNIYKCLDTGQRHNPYRTTFCGIARHADCRNSGIGAKCKRHHYSTSKEFYNYSQLEGNHTPK